MGENEQPPPEPDFAGDARHYSRLHWPKMALRAIILACLVLCILPRPANAQAVRYDYIASTTSSQCAPGAQCPLLVLPGTTVNVCTGTAATLSACLASPATTYTSSGAGSSCPTTAQLTPATGGACTSTADGQGNYGWWVSPGLYSYYLRVPTTAGGGTYGPYPLNIGASAGCISGITCDADYASLPLACAAAGSGDLMVTRVWNGLDTQTLCRIVASGAGKIQAASGKRVTITNFTSLDSNQHLDPSLGGDNSFIILSGPPLNVRWMGADNTGSSDAKAAIQASLNAVQAAGLPVYAPAGSYKIQAAPMMMNNQELYGDGPSTVFVPYGSFQNSGSACGCDNGVFENSAVTSHAPPSPGPTGNNKNISLHDLSILGGHATFEQGIYMAGLDYSQFYNITITNINENGIDLRDGTYSRVKDVDTIGVPFSCGECHALGGGQSGGAQGVNMVWSYNSFDHNKMDQSTAVVGSDTLDFNGNNTGVVCEQNTMTNNAVTHSQLFSYFPDSCQNTLIQNNSSINSARGDIALSASSQPDSGTTIIGNNFSGAAGDSITLTSAASTTLIASNLIQNTGKTGIFVIGGASQTTILSNMILNVSTSSANTYSGIFISPTDPADNAVSFTTIVGNTIAQGSPHYCIDIENYGNTSGGTPQAYASVVTNNNCGAVGGATTTGGINDVGTATLLNFNNYGNTVTEGFFSNLWIMGGTPQLFIGNPGNGVGLKNWNERVEPSTGDLDFRGVNDNNSADSAGFYIHKCGTYLPCGITAYVTGSVGLDLSSTGDLTVPLGTIAPGGGAITMYRCVTAGAARAGAYTAISADCGSSTVAGYLSR